MDSLRKLEELFAKFPGIGPRQARRFVYFLLNKSPSFIREFTHLVEEVKKSTAECSKCHRFFVRSNLPSPISNLCIVCSDPSRDTSLLMIVARDSDFETIEKSFAYKGLYFILGSTIPVLDKEPDKRIRLERLLGYVLELKDLNEVILSLNATPEGEHTANVVKSALENIFAKNGKQHVKISVLGRGLSTGAELEYVDGDTIKNALKNREEV